MPTSVKRTSLPDIAERIAAPLAAIATPQRIAILLAIGKAEACVCHLEAELGWRQPYISQQLMELRSAGILKGRREGRFVFYRLQDETLLDLVLMSARLSHVQLPQRLGPANADRNSACQCPKCSPAFISAEALKAG